MQMSCADVEKTLSYNTQQLAIAGWPSESDGQTPGNLLFFCGDEILPSYKGIIS